jgi:hypothetical protein
VTGFGSTAELADALRRAIAAGEGRAGGTGEDLTDWYAAYIAAEQAGADLPD